MDNSPGHLDARGYCLWGGAIVWEEGYCVGGGLLCGGRGKKGGRVGPPVPNIQGGQILRQTELMIPIAEADRFLLRVR